MSENDAKPAKGGAVPYNQWSTSALRRHYEAIKTELTNREVKHSPSERGPVLIDFRHVQFG